MDGVGHGESVMCCNGRKWAEGRHLDSGPWFSFREALLLWTISRVVRTGERGRFSVSKQPDS